jgi:hypothetical protein
LLLQKCKIINEALHAEPARPNSCLLTLTQASLCIPAYASLID